MLRYRTRFFLYKLLPETLDDNRMAQITAQVMTFAMMLSSSQWSIYVET